VSPPHTHDQVIDLFAGLLDNHDRTSIFVGHKPTHINWTEPSLSFVRGPCVPHCQVITEPPNAPENLFRQRVPEWVRVHRFHLGELKWESFGMVLPYKYPDPQRN
jgi:hypothetical protein